MNVHSIITKVTELGHKVVRFAQRIWNEHLELLDTNPAYRRQLEAGTVALLGGFALHPTVALVATVVLAIYIAAHETSSSAPWKAGYDGPITHRREDRDWDF